ncbi:pyridoxal phosphate-dependent transferase [Staphylotrichum tortipilum]|uniref:aromatic-amino-acid transaminase n=1 Tax=Staphylotrichum tortipilum TaxID=2831512 RepID=A0AAN6MU21_9PEZI|nr:pyridoxal phosphate-dependent transferase [Staphylotrichum longicolle]
MRSALRTGALRGIPPAAASSPTGPLRSSSSGISVGPRNLRGVNGKRLPASSVGFHSTASGQVVEGGEVAVGGGGGGATTGDSGGGVKVEMEVGGELPRRSRVTLAEVGERRRRKGRLVAPTAAPCDAGMFMGPTTGKPKARRWDHHLSPESARRAPCKLKLAAHHLKTPGMLSLGGGLPCPEYFPISSLTLHIPTPPNFSESSTLSAGEDATITKYAASLPIDAPGAAEYDLSIALNYSQATGSAQLTRFVTEHVELVGAAPPYADWGVCLTVGSTGALEQVLRMLCDGPGRGDTLLTEEFSFSTALETAAPMGVGVVGVKMDGEGLVPGELEGLLSGWDVGRGRKPHVLYTVPSGQNPTGATQSEERRREVYEVCRRHDVMIVEDEPYYYLQMGEIGEGRQLEGVEEFLDGLIPTYTSMDVDGRVVRMDSFSKVVVPGSRVGWITASQQLVERFIRHAEVANQGPSGFSQVILHKLLDNQWGHEGYLRWLMNLRVEYTKRRDVMAAACERHLPKEVVSWKPPQAGMFQWLKIDHTRHPDAGTKSIYEIEEEIFNSCIGRGVLVARGSWFRAEQDKPLSGLYFRTTFAAATPENMTEAIRRLGEAIRESYRL